MNGNLSKARLGRLHDTLAGYVERGEIPGLVALVSRRGETHVYALGTASVGGDPMRRDTIVRIASMTKPVTAAAAMVLVEECRLRLDDPVDGLLPELAGRRVLRRLGAALDDTVPAHRPVTVRDLLTYRMGFGSVPAPPGTYPIQAAIAEQRIGGDGPPTPAGTPGPDEWLRRLGTLPLMYQPGERWAYHTSGDVLGVLVARAAGQPFETFLRERIFEPLGMTDTAFSAAGKLDRLATSYVFDQTSRSLVVFDEAAGGQWGRPPAFPSGGGGLVSTADDYLAFCEMLRNKGRYGDARILSRPSVELMTADHLTSRQREEAALFLGGNRGWGFGMSVYVARDDLAAVPGRYGWDGGLGTSGYVDPVEDLVGILLTQRAMDSPRHPPVFHDFWTSAYGAIDD